jgi:hypothetical protein
VDRAQKFFRVNIGGNVETVSVARLKPHSGQAGLQPAMPGKRGRPKKAASWLSVRSLASTVGGGVM